MHFMGLFFLVTIAVFCPLCGMHLSCQSATNYFLQSLEGLRLTDCDVIVMLVYVTVAEYFK